MTRVMSGSTRLFFQIAVLLEEAELDLQRVEMSSPSQKVQNCSGHALRTFLPGCGTRFAASAERRASMLTTSEY